MVKALFPIFKPINVFIEILPVVRDRYNLLAETFRRKLKQEDKASGIQCHMTECEQALECIIEKEDVSEMMQKEKRHSRKSSRRSPTKSHGEAIDH